MKTESAMSRRVSGILILVLIALAVLRIVLADRTTPQSFDEPCHVAAGIKWLERHDYTLDPLHPPLSRYAIAVPLYLAGKRLPALPEPLILPNHDVQLQQYCTELGNAILYSGSGYSTNLLLARIGILPFFALAELLVFLYANRLAGAIAGCVAVLLFSTLPSVLTFSSMAYTDLPATCTQFASLFAFLLWLERPSAFHAGLLGLSAGLAISTKLTSFLFLPCAGLAMFLIHWFSREETAPAKTRVMSFTAALGLAALVLWGSYGFSIGHLDDALGASAMVDSTRHLSGFHIFWAKVKRLDPLVPAPDLLRAVRVASRKNEARAVSYLFGRMTPGGSPLFFPIALGLKTPLSTLLLSALGLWGSLRLARERRWIAIMPAVAVAAILLVTTFVTLKVGIRHVLIVLPLLSVMGGQGASFLLRTLALKPIWRRVFLALLLAWQSIASLKAQNDLFAYFNELAPRDPSRALVTGCDLECGQDVVRLAQELQARHVTHIALAVWSSADLAQLGFPEVEVLRPYAPVSGWVAVSIRCLRTGTVTFWLNGHVANDTQYPQHALGWIEQYQPVARVGKTILLYNIPSSNARVR